MTAMAFEAPAGGSISGTLSNEARSKLSPADERRALRAYRALVRSNAARRHADAVRAALAELLGGVMA